MNFEEKDCLIERERKVRLRKKDNRQKSYEIRREEVRGDETSHDQRKAKDKNSRFITVDVL